MSIRFTCPHCGLETNVADEYAGQSGPCAQCGKTIEVPLLGSAPPSGKTSGNSIALVILVVLVGAVLLCGGLGFLGFSWMAPVRMNGTATRRVLCQNNLKQLGIAMHNYHDTFNSFPPAYIPDENGQPMHSWRVLLLPFLEQGALHDQYDFNEPWDGPNNQALANVIVHAYCCPADTLNVGLDTSYMMIVGPDTISDGPGAIKFADVEDGSSNTIMFVEVSGSGVSWLEPVDLDAEQITYALNDFSEEGIRSDHQDGVNIALCDGSVRVLPDSTDPNLIRNMSTIAGAEDVSGFQPEY